MLSPQAIPANFISPLHFLPERPGLAWIMKPDWHQHVSFEQSSLRPSSSRNFMTFSSSFSADSHSLIQSRIRDCLSASTTRVGADGLVEVIHVARV